MRILLILSLLISTIAFSQDNGEVDLSKIDKTLIGEWKFIKTVDQNGNEVKSITVDRKMPDGKPITLKANGPDILINEDGTYVKKFTPENSDTGVWRIKSNDEIEYEMIIPENSRQGQLLVQTRKMFPNKKWRKDEKGNFLNASTDKILELTTMEMKVEYEENYVLVYKKSAE